MDERLSSSRWENLDHRSAKESPQHIDLEAFEVATGHVFQRTAKGSFMFYQLDRQCQGPLCMSCGFTFCIECGVPHIVIRCASAPQLLGDEVSRDAPREGSTASSPFISSSYSTFDEPTEN
jgi:hypothetical protein